jgi:uncharacterized integral membrane protein (TIGR00698 family)
MNKLKTIIPGLVLCMALMGAALLLTELAGQLLGYVGVVEGENPLSAIFTAVLLGVIIRNTIGVSDVFLKGISFAMSIVLKAGIILLGLRLSLLDVITLGAWGLPIIVACISAALITTLWAARLLNQQRSMGTLTAVGTSICGITAIMGTAPAIKAKEPEISYAVAIVTLFGMVSMFLYPYLAYAFFSGDPVRAGLFLGTAIHDTSQVIGASLIYDQLYSSQQVIDTAAVTKLTRNAFLIAVVPLMSYLYFRNSRAEKKQKPLWELFPYFVLGFLFMAVLRTIGDTTAENRDLAFGLLSPDLWTELWQGISHAGTTYFLSTALAAVGLSTNLAIFRRLGVRPLIVGIIAALTVSLVSLVMVSLLGGWI